MIKKFIAFTLAETLIVMGILGVVATLTIPNIGQSSGEKETIAMLKKINTDLNSAYARAKEKYGDISSWPANSYFDRVSESLNVEQTCTTSPYTPCFNTFKNISGTVTNMGVNGSSAILANGSSISINNMGEITVDVDGPKKGFNTLGIDIFYFEFHNGRTNYTPSNTLSFAKNADNPLMGADLTKWVLKHDNMDYLHCDTLTDANPTCN